MAETACDMPVVILHTGPKKAFDAPLYEPRISEPITKANLFGLLGLLVSRKFILAQVIVPSEQAYGEP